MEKELPFSYLSLYTNCKLTKDPAERRQLDRVALTAINNQVLYQLVEHAAKVPWPVIAALHFRESGQSFKCHLHNGDPLRQRTVRVPEGRPVVGMPPFTWTTSAIDALSDFWKPKNWDLNGALEFLERFNGMGYRKRNLPSPYIWGFTDVYKKGLYVADGKFDSEKIENRPGCVSILKTLHGCGVSLDFTRMQFDHRTLH